MHYVICYDLQNDRLRDKCAKLLERNGCRRLQKSVYLGPNMEKKHSVKLQLSLRQLFARLPMEAGDSVYVIPLPNEYVGETAHFGDNNAIPALTEKKLKVIL